MNGPRKYPTEIQTHPNREPWPLVWRRQLPGKDTCGLCDSAEHAIYLKLKEPRMDTFHYLIHEMLHCIEADYSFEIDHRVIYQLQEPLAQMIILNLPAFLQICHGKNGI